MGRTHIGFIAAFALMIGCGVAHATFVPAGTLTISADFAPLVNLTTDTIETDDGSPDYDNGFIFNGGTGQFLHASTSHSPKSSEGSFSGNVLTFDPKVGNVISYTGAASIDDLLTFTDASNGETYDFDLDGSITTLSNSTTGSGTTIGLYLLGDLTATGSNTYSTETPTALTLSLTQTGTSNWSLSGTLANPPPGTGLPVPEPASIALLGGGLSAVGFLRRRKAK